MENSEQNTEHQRILDLLEPYALGVLDNEDLELVDKHLANGCTVCQQRLLELGEVTSLLALSAPIQRVNVQLKDRIMTSIRQDQYTENSTKGLPSTSSKNWFWLMTAIAATIIVYLGIRTFTLSEERNRLKNTLSQEQIKTADLATRMTSLMETNDSLHAQSKKDGKTSIELRSELQIQKEQNRRLRSELSNLKSEDSKEKLELTQSQQQITECEEMIARSEIDIEKLKEDIKELENVTELIESPATKFVNLSRCCPQPTSIRKSSVGPLGTFCICLYVSTTRAS